MRVIFLLSLLLFAAAGLEGTENPLSDSEDIHHIVFLSDKILYMPRSGREFGFFGSSNGEILTQYRLE